MKEYDLFVKTNGDTELVCGGQFVIGADGLGTARNIATLWNVLESFGERVVEIREVGIDRLSGWRTYSLKTVPSCEPPRRY